jgi:hypothetical protein
VKLAHGHNYLLFLGQITTCIKTSAWQFARAKKYVKEIDIFGNGFVDDAVNQAVLDIGQDAEVNI